MRKSRDEGWWMDAMTATRLRRARSRSASTTAQAVDESRPDVGSSQQMSRGLVSISWPTMSRLRSPPEMVLALPSVLDTMVSAHDCRCRSSMDCSTCSSFCARGMPARRSRAEKARDSRTVRPANVRSSCSMKATWRLRDEDQARSVPYHTWPELTGPRRAMAFRRLVLPQPVGPMSATARPASTSPEHGASASTSRCGARLTSVSPASTSSPNAARHAFLAERWARLRQLEPPRSRKRTLRSRQCTDSSCGTSLPLIVCLLGVAILLV
mmetsp:Transcript_21093/g.62979  ORF Transcript_21093/g.62979 Transcript_21093/m.62979 type:complete len:269 (+) Transcript_21093:307-1113(+)